jgi:hypothetical protein
MLNPVVMDLGWAANAFMQYLGRLLLCGP